VAVLGEAARTAWFALAGADVYPAEDASQARAAWASIDPDTAVVVLTPMAADALSSVAGATDSPLCVTLPTPLPPDGLDETLGALGS
jgi:vacuolar-type H+-ATPase subunit F/Vma7